MEIMIEKMKQTSCQPTFIILLLLPLIGTALFGTLIQKQQQEAIVPIAIVDNDQTNISKVIVKRMKKHKRIHIIETTEKNANQRLTKNEIDSIYIIKKGFQHQLLNEKRESTIIIKLSSLSVASGIVREILASEVTRITSSIKAANQVLQIYKRAGLEEDAKRVWNDAYDYTNEQWHPKPLMTIDYMEKSIDGNERMLNKKQEIFAPFMGIWGFFTMISCFLVSDWIIHEKKIVFPRIRTSYKGLSTYLFQTTGGIFLLQTTQAMGSFFLFSYLKFIDKELLLLLVMFLYLFFCFGLALFSALSFQQSSTYYVFGVLFSLFLAVFGGSFFPIPDLLGKYEFLTRWLPTALLLKSDFSFSMLFHDHLLNLISLVSVSILLWGYPKWRLYTNDKY